MRDCHALSMDETEQTHGSVPLIGSADSVPPMLKSNSALKLALDSSKVSTFWSSKAIDKSSTF